MQIALGLVLIANAAMALRTYSGYEDMLDYCEGFGRSGLDCLGATRGERVWLALNVELAVWLLVEIAVLVVLGAAVIKRRPADQ